MTKRGDDEAKDVKATVRIDNEEKTQTLDLITGDGFQIELEFPIAQGIARDEEMQARQHQPGYEPPYFPTAHAITERVEWTTKLGAPRVHAPETSRPFGLQRRG